MSVLVLDPGLQKRLIKQRRRSGADRWDEVWDGVYVMSPLPNDGHQKIVTFLTFILQGVIGEPGLGEVRPGINVSDRDKKWKQNYRCPDVAVILRGGRAINRDKYWLGGPDFAVEIVSPRDRARDKIPFYAAVGVRELLVIDRDPWVLELYRLQGDQLPLVGSSTPEGRERLASAVVPLTFRLVPGDPHPRIEVRHVEGHQEWLI
jgi:Uma2 family endonuclease